ncbi:ABC transporter permease [Cryptosporangium phraense]|uniref:FtsX-like permease family protein n=1 Tax=Cryptosporangium phraense TaxID=2593070 RepID=A0A545AWM9_9ACTN|nr:FtsX-like permease family protein [Cryptosporangium phraense]TQS45734.1 FtsX-like permease family protein [Cryptosporangium phraense]
MRRVLLSGISSRRRRLAGTFLAVLLGVAFLAATLTMTATMTSAIDGFFTRANAGIDVVVRGGTALGDGPNPARAPIPGSLLSTVRNTPGVAVAEPVVEGFGQLLGRDGTAIAVNGPRVAGSWVPDRELNPYHVVEGRPPANSGDVVVNQATAEAGNLHVGDRTTLLTPAPRPVRVVGIVRFGDSGGFGATSYVGLTPADATAFVVGGKNQLSSIQVRSDDEISRATLAERITKSLPTGVEAVTGDAATDETTSAIEDGFLTFLRALLGAFAGVALLVAVLSIHNTFAILVAQRTRETALLRAVGATRRQVLAGVLAEALIVGVVASGAGVAAGYGLAGLLKAAFGALGFDAPVDGLVFPLSTVAICVPVGVVATVVAAVTPAVRASRVAPIEALREAAAEAPRISRVRAVAGAGLAVAGLVAVGAGSAVFVVGVGAVLVVAGVLALAPLLVGPLAATPVRGVTARLARGNTRRNPRRTAGAAAALLIGVGVVTLFTVAAGSLKASSTSDVETAFRGDFAISSGQRFGNGSLSADIAPALARLPQVATVASVGSGQAVLAGQGAQVSFADPPSLARLVSFADVTGADISELGPGQVAVSADSGHSLGDRLSVRYPDGVRSTVVVTTVYRANPLVGSVLLDTSEWAPHSSQALAKSVYVGLADGVSPADGRKALTSALRPFGNPTLSDADELAGANADAIGQLLNLVYVLLAIAVITALLGIANTLSLGVHERTRELGLLRAVGATRRQVRSLVRWESVLIALFGTVLGAALGTALGWALVRVAGSSFAVPAVPLAVIVVGGAAAGLLAGARPTRTAARLDVLRAIATE